MVASSTLEDLILYLIHSSIDCTAEQLVLRFVQMKQQYAIIVRKTSEKSSDSNSALECEKITDIAETLKSTLLLMKEVENTS